METGQIGLAVKLEGIGTLDTRSDKDLHSVKSFAGKAFRAPFVKSVCVYDPQGVARLYLVKRPDGTIHREERK